jgi:putative transposase
LQEDNKWYASFVANVAEKPKLNQIIDVLGIDVNSDFFATSAGELIANPKYAKAKAKLVRNRQRKLSRAKKRSRNRAKVLALLAKTCAQITNRRKNFLHLVSARKTKSSALICVETLKIEQMKKNHLAAKAIQDAGWGSLFNLLKYKSDLKGGYFHAINQWLPSSKICNKCGHKKEHLDLKCRVFECEVCGHTEHRDINAACNIAEWGLQEVLLRYPNLSAGTAAITPLDVVVDVFVFGGEHLATSLKEEATRSLAA